MAVFIICGRSNDYFNDNTFKSIIMNWYIGQAVVCIKDHKGFRFKTGDTFTIKGLSRSHCKCDEVEIDIGLLPYSDLSECTICSITFANGNTNWFSEKYFSPFDELMAEQIEELKLELSL